VKFLEQKKQEKAMAEQVSATTEAGTGSSPKPITKRRPAKQV